MILDIHTHNAQTHAQTIETVGIHPWHAANCDLAEVEKHAPSADAIGEIGLDYACDVPREVQTAVLRAQLTLAEQLEKPVVLHCVRAFEEVMKIVADYRLKAVIFHGFIGSKEQAQRALAQGYFLSFGERTFHSPKTIEALRITPLSQLFAESDESPTPIEEIYSKIADLQGVSTEDLDAAANSNFAKIFLQK
ncbi:MAG: TatD family hydrolase [Alistipes sp.]|nr:TatD family hydrolase [Alistipes sp.]